MAVFSCILLFVASWSIVANAKGPVENLEVVVNATSGGFQLYLSGKLWFNSGDVYIHNNGKWYSTQDGTLTMVGKATTSTGRLDWGPMDIVNFNWQDSDGGQYSTYTVVFQEVPVVIFGQQWNDGGNNTSVGKDDTTLSMWPTLRFEDGQNGVELGYTAWAKKMVSSQQTGIIDSSTNEIYNGHDGGFPMAIFDSKMENTLVIAPQNTFMSAHQTTWKPDGVDVPLWGSGFLGTVESIPKGYSMETTMVAGQNVSDTIDKWGKLIRQRYGKTDDYRLTDFTANYLGYYTDNGACYFYYNGSYKNYEEVLIDVKKHADLDGIPYRYLQLDSWWYYKGIGDGVKNWTAMPSIFPRGIGYVSNLTGMPIAAHNRYFAPDTDYAKQNGGQYDFIIDEGVMSLPNDVTFWRDIFRIAATEWNLKTYEQDWLLTESEKVHELYADLELGEKWLREMGEAAKEFGITIQYCTASMRDMLQSVTIPAVTQARITPDYQPGNDNWKVGDSVMLAHALSIAGFKDTFHTVPVESKCKFNHEETSPALETYISALTGGPIGPSDQVGSRNKTLIMATCMADGLLLKPTKPTMSIDGTFLQRAFGTGGPDGHVYSSYTVVSGFAWYQIISVDLQADYNLMPREFPSCSAYKPQTYYPESVALQYNLDGTIRGDAVHIKQNTDVIPLKKCGRDDFEYWIVAPVFPGTGGAFLGELNKIMTVSEQRVLTVIKFGDTYIVKLRGAPEEVIYMSTYDLSSSKIVTVKCKIGLDGTGSLSFSDATKLTC